MSLAPRMAGLVVVVSGSRDLPLVMADMVESSILQAIDDFWAEFDGGPPKGRHPIFVMHGAHRSGADHFADEFAKKCAHTEPIPVPADWAWWRERGNARAAGPVRNAAIVKLAEAFQVAGYRVVVLAFPMGESRGTRGFIDLAIRAGLEVDVHEMEGPR